MRFLSVALATLALAFPGAIRAQLCEVGLRPGSTLLFPYFEVDLSRPDGLTTLLSINSASNKPTLARVVVWTDWALPELAFDLYLAPNDVQTINLRDVFSSGSLPSTGGPGIFEFGFCATNSPSYGTPAIKYDQLTRVVGGLTSGAEIGPSGHGCVGSARADGHAHGYVTVDTVGICTGLVAGYDYGLGTPLDRKYFTEVAVVNDVLWGDLLYVDPSGNSAQGVEAVALQSVTRGLSGPLNTFYGRLVGWDGSDRRSPLPTRWAVRYVGGGAFDGGTDLIVFRDPRTYTIASCGQPHWYPLLSKEVVVRDEDAHVTLTLTDGDSFPLATQRVSVKSLLGTGAPPFGRLDMSLRLPADLPAGAWVMPVFTAGGRYSVDFNAQPLDSGCGQWPY